MFATKANALRGYGHQKESHTQNRSTTKESRLSKSDSVRREGGRKTAADVLEGFAPGHV
jgi:hypothetical protein